MCKERKILLRIHSSTTEALSSRSGIRFGSPVENPELKRICRSEEFLPHVYDDLTLDGSSQEGRIYWAKKAQRRIAVEKIIQAQVKTTRSQCRQYRETLMKEIRRYGR